MSRTVGQADRGITVIILWVVCGLLVFYIIAIWFGIMLAKRRGR